MASNPQILTDLQMILEAGQDLELLTTYKGVPFTFKAKVLTIDGERAHIKVLDPAMVCLEREKRVKLLGSDYFEPASATVLSFNIIGGQVELGNFTYLGAKLGERMIVRVEPKTPLEVSIVSGEETTKAELADISINGMGIKIPNANYNATLKPGATIHLSVGLPKGTFALSGMVLSVAKIDEYYRLSVRFVESGSHRQAIFNYMIDRRAEIEKELKEDYQHALAASNRSSK